MAPEEELPAREPGREGRAEEHDMSERLVFDLSGIDWDDEESIRRATRQIWEFTVADLAEDGACRTARVRRLADLP